ncbi:DUF1573 domain-containing protein [Hymenobacter negativus]|uniref:DUF1573 domain-containing protein n=1 Tax=Hymenobacter negativus TaxID=2795026 RepID=A0ABS3QBY3_9BACT|nr:DUF1573 domain-containing protein [Hymenobacter negativus]MBO2008765.1 DUF1573 domain-containing protein [Hymenobacter negativus]
MKPVTILAALLLAGTATSAQQLIALNTPAITSPARSAAPTAIAWEKTAHQFGDIKQGVPVTATFKFTNKSKTPVLLADVHGSCGCTVPQWSKEPVLPGKSSIITATFNAANAGPFTKTVTVATNVDDISGPQVLTLQGTVLAKAE